MKTTAFVSMAIAMGVLAGQPASADPIARNHPGSKSQQSPKPAAQGGEQSDDKARRTSSTQSDAAKPARDSEADGVPTGDEDGDLGKRTADARSTATASD
jgi:hypothetical protein